MAKRLIYVYFENVNGDIGNIIKVVKEKKGDMLDCNVKEYRKELGRLNTTERSLYIEYMKNQDEDDALE
jgi:hypothetical protein